MRSVRRGARAWGTGEGGPAGGRDSFGGVAAAVRVSSLRLADDGRTRVGRRRGFAAPAGAPAGAGSATSLLAEFGPAAVGRCGGDGCGWLFLNRERPAGLVPDADLRQPGQGPPLRRAEPVGPERHRAAAGQAAARRAGLFARGSSGSHRTGALPGRGGDVAGRGVPGQTGQPGVHSRRPASSLITISNEATVRPAEAPYTPRSPSHPSPPGGGCSSGRSRRRSSPARPAAPHATNPASPPARHWRRRATVRTAAGFRPPAWSRRPGHGLLR